MRDEGIEIHEVTYAIRNPVSNACDHHAAKAITDQNHVVQIFKQEDVYYIGNVGIQVNIRMCKMYAFTATCEGRREYPVAFGAK